MCLALVSMKYFPDISNLRLLHPQIEIKLPCNIILPSYLETFQAIKEILECLWYRLLDFNYLNQKTQILQKYSTVVLNWNTLHEVFSPKRHVVSVTGKNFHCYTDSLMKTPVNRCNSKGGTILMTLVLSSPYKSKCTQIFDLVAESLVYLFQELHASSYS